MKNEEDELMRNKMQVFFDKKIPVHINLKNRTFYNGLITEMSSDFCILNDRVLGELPVFFMQVYEVEPQGSRRNEQQM